jgi:hypothetical protein
MFVYNQEHDIWMHKTKTKLVLNFLLRLFQFWTERPFVIVSVVKLSSTKKPLYVERYTFTRVKYVRIYKWLPIGKY